MRAGFTAVTVAIVTALAGPAAADAAITIGPASQTSTAESGKLTFTVTRSMDLTAVQSASVKVSTVAGTATPGADFTPVTNQTVTLGASFLGATTQTVDVPILADTLDEPDESFTVVLSEPSGDTLGTPSTATGTIKDDDPTPVLSLGTPQPVTEGTGGTPPALVFPVALDAASGRTVSVTYATADGTATDRADYTATSGTLTIPAGSMTGQVTVPVTPDALDEDDETVSLTLSAPSNATLAPAATMRSGTITDDDSALVSVTGATVAEGAAGTTTIANAQIDLSTASSRPVTVGYTTIDGTAVAPADYTATSGQVTIPAGQRFALVPVTVIGDAEVEKAEVLGVQLKDPVGAALASGQDIAPIFITNDDSQTVTLPPPTSVTGPTPPSTGGSNGDGTATRPVKLAAPTYDRRTGRLRYKVTCPAGGGACRVLLTVFSVPAATSKVKALRQEQQLASLRQTVAENTTGTFTLKLSARVRGWLKAARTIKTNAYAVSRDAQSGFSTARRSATLKR